MPWRDSPCDLWAGLVQSTVTRIVNGKRWSHLQKEVNFALANPEGSL